LARFSNGGIEILGKVALTRFANSQGLTKVGDTTWKESLASGEAISGQAGTGSFGLIQSGALEGSTVDLSDQLVHLIIAQQAYQANAQVITTEKTIVQTILNA
ncbi:MAG: flagellar hook-basal body complex protein, partial [Methyloprofundus sp.]|nr:flagellar hook-basal body complex protein [Methyloprofundus sp.]